MQIAHEIELQSKCKNCPNIVRFKEQFTSKEMAVHCIVMEYMPGGDLQQLLDANDYQPLSEAFARTITYQISQALSYMHQHGIIHRDIKLENVMLSNNRLNCNAKLADFGLAQWLDTTPAIDFDQSGQLKTRVAGTTGYQAPEVISHGAHSPVSDVWSLGCLLYAMITVALPFAPNKSGVSTINYERFELDSLPVSDACKNLLTCMLKKEPSDRISIEQMQVHPFFSESH